MVAPVLNSGFYLPSNWNPVVFVESDVDDVYPLKQLANSKIVWKKRSSTTWIGVYRWAVHAKSLGCTLGSRRQTWLDGFFSAFGISNYPVLPYKKQTFLLLTTLHSGTSNNLLRENLFLNCFEHIYSLVSIPIQYFTQYDRSISTPFTSLSERRRRLLRYAVSAVSRGQWRGEWCKKVFKHVSNMLETC